MATVKLGTTKTANKALSYAEKRAEVASGIECSPGVAKAQMKATRELHGKSDGIQAHTVIQSFKPEETTPKEANNVGQELAEKIAPGHECMIYTHTDKEHIHNHIVINAVNMDSGKKYQAHGQQAISKVQRENDEICRSRGLSIPEKTANVRYTQTEQHLLEKNQSSWKDEIREAVNIAKREQSTKEDFQQQLQDWGIEVKERGKNISYKHPDVNKWVRGKTLGEAYDREAVEHELERPVARKEKQSAEEWDAFERDTNQRRTQRVKEAERTAEKQNDRNRERPKQAERTPRKTNQKSRGRDQGLSL